MPGTNKQGLTLFALAVLIAVSLPSPARAVDGVTLGFGAGYSRHDVSPGDWDDGSLREGGSVDRFDVGLKFFGALRIGRGVGLEVGLVSLGDTTFSGNSRGGALWRRGDVEGKASTVGVSFAGTGDLWVGPRSRAFAKLGVFRWNTDVTIRDRDTVYGDDQGSDLMFGLGFDYYFTLGMGLRAEWERYTGIGHSDALRSHAVDLLSGSVLIRF